METGLENLTQGTTDLARNSTVSYKLEGWPAAAVLMSFPAAAVLICAIKAFSKN